MNSLTRVRHPETWSSDDVIEWLSWCVGEYGIRQINMGRFYMNGKGLCLLTRWDFLERIPEVGDIIYNSFQKLISNAPEHKPFVYQPTPSYHHSHRYFNNVGHPTTTNDASKVRIVSSGVRSRVRDPVVLHRSSPRPPTKFIPILPHPPSLIKDEGISGELNTESVHHTTMIPDSALSPASTTASDVIVDSTSLPHFDLNADHDSERAEMVLQSKDGIPLPYQQCRLLWEFISHLLGSNDYSYCIHWTDEEHKVFRISNPAALANLWGVKKSRPNMTYEKLSRALRYYYKMGIMQKVPGRRLTYRFLQSPQDIRKFPRGSFRKPFKKSSNSSHLYPESPESDENDRTTSHLTEKHEHELLNAKQEVRVTDKVTRGDHVVSDSCITSHESLTVPIDYSANDKSTDTDPCVSPQITVLSSDCANVHQSEATVPVNIDNITASNRTSVGSPKFPMSDSRGVFNLDAMSCLGVQEKPEDLSMNREIEIVNN